MFNVFPRKRPCLPYLSADISRSRVCRRSSSEERRILYSCHFRSPFSQPQPYKGGVPRLYSLSLTSPEAP